MSITRGRRVTRAVAATVAEMYFQGVSTRRVARALQELGIQSWRPMPVSRISGIVRHVAVLTAVGVQADGRRSVLGISVAVSEAERHWREFLQRLGQQGLHGVRYVVSDDQPMIDALSFARRWTAAVDWHSVAEAEPQVTACNAVLDPHVEADYPQLKLP